MDSARNSEHAKKDSFMIELTSLKPNPENPRDIDQHKFDKLCESISRDPKFMKLRPIIIDGTRTIIAGNMRFRALRALEFKSIPDEWVRVADELTEEERRRFIVIDNMGFGFFEWDILTSYYSEEELTEWGIDLPIDPIETDEEIPPVSHGLKIQCDSLDDLITLRDLLDIDPDAKSITFGKFKMIFENRTK
jgi:hypothetical protein